VYPLTVLPPMLSMPCPGVINETCGTWDRWEGKAPPYSVMVIPGQVFEDVASSLPALAPFSDATSRLCCTNNLQVKSLA
jgi:hypothetical protein